MRILENATNLLQNKSIHATTTLCNIDVYITACSTHNTNALTIV